MQLILIIIVIAAVAFVLSRGRSQFQVDIENGKIIATRGAITAAMRDDFEMAVSGVRSGRIIGTKTPRGLSLSFRGDIGEMTQQRLRNIAGIHHR